MAGPSPELKAALKRHHNTHLSTRSFSPTGELVSSSEDGGLTAKIGVKGKAARPCGPVLPHHHMAHSPDPALLECWPSCLGCLPRVSNPAHPPFPARPPSRRRAPAAALVRAAG